MFHITIYNNLSFSYRLIRPVNKITIVINLCALERGGVTFSLRPNFWNNYAFFLLASIHIVSIPCEIILKRFWCYTTVQAFKNFWRTSSVSNLVYLGELGITFSIAIDVSSKKLQDLRTYCLILQGFKSYFFDWVCIY